MTQNGRIISKLFRTSVVSIIAAAIAAMLGIVIDGIVIGRYLGDDSMASYSLVTPLVNLTTAFSGILTTGAQVICAQHLGAGKVRRARRAFSMCMLMTIVISAILMIGILLLRDQIGVFLGAKNDAVLKLSSDYMLGMVFSIPSVLLLFEFNSLMRLDGDANRVIVAVAVMTVLDIAGDLLNVFVFKLGMFGMGLTTSISYFVALVIMLLHFTKKNIIFRFSLRGLRTKDILDILGTGSSSAVGSASVMVRNTVMNHIMASTAQATVAVAALGVLSTLVTFTSAVMIGIGMTCAMLAGMILGEQDRSAAHSLVSITLKVVLVVGGVLTVVLFVFAHPIASIFGSDMSQDRIELSATGIRMYSISLILSGINNAFVNYSQGMRRMITANLFCFLQNMLFAILPALALAGVLGTNAVWLSYLFSEGLTFTVIIISAAVRKRGLPIKLSDYLFLKEPFGAPEDKLYEASVSGASDVPEISAAIGEFCVRQGADDSTAQTLRMFVEETCDNIIRYGFSDKKKHSIDLRLIRNDDGWTIRFRDNCRLFDPTEWAGENIEDNSEPDTGIKKIYSCAKSVDYLNTLDLNILTIRI